MPVPLRPSAFVVAATLLAGLAATGRAEPPGKADGGEAVLARFSLPKGGALLTVPVEVGGHTLSFAIDTGCSAGLYDSSLVPLLGHPLSAQGARTSDGVMQVTHYPCPDARLGGLSLNTGVPVATADLRRLREGLGEDVYGCVGMDFLSRHVFRVDPDRGEVVFLKALGSAPGDRLPVTIEDRVAFVRAGIPGLAEPERFMVDTGAASGGGSGLLRVDAVSQLVGLGKLKPFDTALAVSGSGQSLRQRGRLADFELAGHRHAGLIFAASGRSFLGVNYWSRYVATFDLGGGAIYLKPSGRYNLPDTHDLSGLTFVRLGGKATVVDVKADSPAARAGVRTRDVLLKANGVGVGDAPLAATRRALAVKGASVSLMLERDGERADATFILPE